MDLLLAHSAWVRSLARRLVSESSGADDLAQEVWLAALQRPQGEMRSPRAWLAGLLSNLARQRHRGEARRREREERAAAGATSTEPSVAETFESVATGRDLAGLVLELEEPFRTVVALRYYEDLPPRRIAKRLGIPVRTVNSRLSRGIERLRERWKLRQRARGEDSERWARALFALLRPAGSQLVPGGACASAPFVPLGVLLMNLKILLGVVVLGGGAMAWWLCPPRGSPSSQTGELASTSVASRPLESRPEPESPASAVPGPERSPVTTQAAAPAVATDPLVSQMRILRGRVLDVDALPLSGIQVQYRSLGGDVLGTATSGALGRFELEVPRGSGELTATDEHLVTVMRGCADEHSEVEPLVVVAPRIELTGVVLDESGAPLSGARVSFQLPTGFHARFEIVFDATRGGGWRTQSDESGRFELVPVPALAGAALVAELGGFAPWRGEVPPQGDRALVLTLLRPTEEVERIVGRVVDHEARAVAGAWVTLGKASTISDSAGEFRLERADALDSFELRAMKDGYRLATVQAAEDGNGRPAWPGYVVIALGEPPLSLDGRVVDARGNPRADMRLWIADPTPFGILQDEMLASVEYYLGGREKGPLWDAYCSSLQTDAEGGFLLEGLLERDYSLRVMDPRTLQIHEAGPFRAGMESVEIVFPDGELGRIRGRLVAVDGRGVAGVRVALLANTFGGVWTDVSSGSVLSDAEGRFGFDGIAVETPILTLSLSGDDVLPGWRPVRVQRGDEPEVELSVAVRCHFQVDLGFTPTRADAVRVLDGDGAAMTLYRIAPGGILSHHEFPIVEGRSDSLGVDDRARTLVLLEDGVEVLRMPIDLHPRTLNRIVP